MARTAVMPLGIVIERRELDSPWQRWTWRPVAVLPGAPDGDRWRVLVTGDRVTRYHAATLPLRLYPNETLAYLQAMSNEPPVVYVVLRRKAPDPDGHEVTPLLVTAAPYEAELHLDAGDDIVQPVPMPPGLVAWVSAFVAKHHVEEHFVKRRRHDRIQGVEDA
jgi:hypothetical protein